VSGSVRLSRPDDSPRLQEIERDAGLRFREVGLDGVAEDEPLSKDIFVGYALAERAWCAVDDDDEPLGYVLVDDVDGESHIAQISVHPDHQGTGVGRALVGQVEARARRAGQSGVTLTTYAEVPWNRPLYEHLGFVVVADDEAGPELRAIRAAEIDSGLDPAPRVCMRLPLGS
jgi:ribosomal protein S18 acetylase RimI-like enzyme